jgi:hypothetical protein
MAEFVRRGLRDRGEPIVKNLNESKKRLDPSNNWEGSAENFVATLPNSLQFTNDTKYEFMFNILDTVHDVFEGNRTDHALFSMFGVGKTTNNKELRHGLTEFVFGLEKILQNNNINTFKYLLKYDSFFKATGFRSFWVQYLELAKQEEENPILGMDLAAVKTKLIDSIKELGAIKAYNFHSQLVKNVTTSEYTVQEIRGGNVMNDIFTKFERYYAAVDATKTRFFTSTKLILTPAMLLDSANTHDLDYTMLFVDCQIINNKDFFIVKFNTTSQQMTCKFHVTMLIFQSENVLFKTILERSKINDNRQTFLVQGMTLKLIHQSTVLIVSPDDGTKGKLFKDNQTRSNNNNAQFLNVSIVLYHNKEFFTNKRKRTNSDLEILKSMIIESNIMNSSCTIIWQSNYTGISMNQCSVEIIKWKEQHIGKKPILTPRTRGLQYMMIQFFLDFKRMGDAYQITYLKAYNKHMAKIYNNKLIKSNMPFIYFTTQDILAVCQAIGISESQDIFERDKKIKSGDATTGLPFVFNTQSQWMMGSNVNHKEHHIYHTNQVVKQTENFKKKQKSQNDNNNKSAHNRSNFVKKTLELASKYKYLTVFKNEHEMVFKHFEILSRLNTAGRKAMLEEWANANLSLKAQEHGYPEQKNNLDNQGKKIPMISFKARDISIAKAWEDYYKNNPEFKKARANLFSATAFTQ